MNPADSSFHERPILNSPYDPPSRHWDLDEAGQPTRKINEGRRLAEFITPLLKSKKQKGLYTEQNMVFDKVAEGLGDRSQQYDRMATINRVRDQVEQWRLSDESKWRVTPETARLLKHWRHHSFSDIRPFFCQVEAVETAIWLTEVAPKMGRVGRELLEYLDNANRSANPELSRLALKLATGAGKTTVMAMLIAWQTINSVRRPQSKFTRGFLVVTPGITIKDRLRVLQPNDPDSYYQKRELVPSDMLPALEKAKIVITNYHAFKRRERMDLSKGCRALLQGRGETLNTLESEGQMLQRVMPELTGMKNVLILNDEAHHCYREKPGERVEEELKGEEKKEAEKNSKAARLWISGLETVGEKLGINRVIDLSATPFFLRGSGYAEGTLFPWTLNDFSLMDAIECGIVKLPRVPISDNIPGSDMPIFRNLWEHIGTAMPKKGRGSAGPLDPLKLPPMLLTALEALYGHYQKVFERMREAGHSVPPCFIVVCNNTSTSKLVYDYISGFRRDNGTFENGRLELFRNFREDGSQFPRPRTLLIDSEQLESGEALDKDFREHAADEIARFRREILARTGDQQKAESISDQELLREVMNTVGKKDRLGKDRLGTSIRCVVSVSMLTEGWDANTVSHVLGIRAFGTQLLCEQVVGRALRRQSYDLNEEGLFDVEYADVLGIPFDFAAEPVVVPVKPPRETVPVQAMSPERDALEICFPRVEGYRVEFPEERLEAKFNQDSVLELSPELVGPSMTRNQGIIGEGVDLNLVHTDSLRFSTLLYHLTKRLLCEKYRDPDEEPKLYLFGQLKRIVRLWLEDCLVCKDGTYHAQLMYQELADMACERISAAITRAEIGSRPVKAVFAPYNPTGSTAEVKFSTSLPVYGSNDSATQGNPTPSKRSRYETDAARCHVNWAILDSDWEAEFCRIAESHPQVRAYVKNHGLGLEIPYRSGSKARTYLPDFIVLVNDGRGDDDLLHLIVEIKGYRGEDAKDKKATMDIYWVPGVNNYGGYGRWASVEFTDVHEMEADFDRELHRQIQGFRPKARDEVKERQGATLSH